MALTYKHTTLFKCKSKFFQAARATTVRSQRIENSITLPFIFRVGRQTIGEK